MPFDQVRLARLREQAVLTQNELATKAGLSLLSVHKIETGQQQPRPATIRKLAHALEVRPRDLMAMDDER
jgi:transcriptional regulator with XRE-family HTH domain